ncbi:MAG TPA: hypothetical protein VK590_02215 [Saprospiraceae bacterium]|nr:hypothetical protein [Saprospiraceae bacterium]
MPALTKEHIQILGPLIDPFERSREKTFDLEELKERGEVDNSEFIYAIYDGMDNGLPTNPKLILTIEERDKFKILEGGKYFEKCYLWVIDNVSIKIMLENTPNVLRGSAIPQKPYVCHTNITGCEKAMAGGEMYFCEDGNIYLNFSSDRYGYRGDDKRKTKIVEVMEYMKYKNIILLKEFF